MGQKPLFAPRRPSPLYHSLWDCGYAFERQLPVEFCDGSPNPALDHDHRKSELVGAKQQLDGAINIGVKIFRRLRLFSSALQMWHRSPAAEGG